MACLDNKDAAPRGKSTSSLGSVWDMAARKDETKFSEIDGVVAASIIVIFWWPDAGPCTDQCKN